MADGYRAKVSSLSIFKDIPILSTSFSLGLKSFNVAYLGANSRGEEMVLTFEISRPKDPKRGTSQHFPGHDQHLAGD